MLPKELILTVSFFLLFYLLRFGTEDSEINWVLNWSLSIVKNDRETIIEIMDLARFGRIDKCEPSCIPTGYRFLGILPH